jgi:hypothetical protein
MQDLGTPGSLTRGATGINNYGQLVGCSGADAFIWTESGGTQNLNIPDSPSPFALSYLGHVVGAQGINLMQAFLWTGAPGAQELFFHENLAKPSSAHHLPPRTGHTPQLSLLELMSASPPENSTVQALVVLVAEVVDDQ